MLNSTLCSDYNLMHNNTCSPTKNSACRDGLSVEPKRDLGQDDGHYARQVRLDHKVSNLPLQMEMGSHHCIFTYYGRRETYCKRWEETRWIHVVLCLLANILPVLDLMVSLSTVCPIRSYWLSLDPSGATSTDKVALRVQTYVTSVKV